MGWNGGGGNVGREHGTHRSNAGRGRSLLKLRQVTGKVHTFNRLFATSGLKVREAYTVASGPNGIITEQIDGAIELDVQVYVVEMKWLKDEPMVRPPDVGAIYISGTGYTDGAIQIARLSSLLRRGPLGCSHFAHPWIYFSQFQTSCAGEGRLQWSLVSPGGRKRLGGTKASPPQRAARR